MKPLLIAGGVIIGLIAISRLLRRKRRGPVRRARREIERAVGDIETSIQGLTARAKKLRGEAKENVDVQMRALESRREQLMERLHSLTNSSARSAERAAAQAS
jgi:hypothetical protein